jgi:4-amino-4-deoxy-L-arabinose transferase-like glycosyltransferase
MLSVWYPLMKPLHAAAALIVMIGLSLPGLTVDLDRLGPQPGMEEYALLGSRETWKRQHEGETDAWLAPSMNGNPRLRKPPLMVWAHMMAWTGLDPATASPATLIERARLVSAGFAVVLALGTFWIGCTLRDRELGLFGAGISLAMLLLQQQARLATYDMPLTALSSIAIAAALWAMRPFEATGARCARVLTGWILAGLAGGAAVLTKGIATALLLIALPVLLIALLDRRRSIGRALGFAGMLMIIAAGSGWWFIYIHDRYPKLVSVMSAEYTLNTTEPSPVYYYLKLLWWVTIPWVVFVAAGLIHPFTMSVDESRRRRRAVWVWFIALLVLFSIPAAKEDRYLTMAGPALAVVMAQVWRDQLMLAQENRRDPRERWVIDTHWLLMLVLACSIGSIVAGHSIWPGKHWLRGELIAPVSTPAAMGLAFTLAALAIWGWWSHRRGQTARAFAAMLALSSLASWSYWKAYANSRDSGAVVQDDAAQVRDVIGEAPIVYLQTSESTHPSYEFIFYLDRIIGKLRIRQLSQAGEEFVGAHYVVTSHAQAELNAMSGASYAKVLEFHDRPRQTSVLWRSPE